MTRIIEELAEASMATGIALGNPLIVASAQVNGSIVSFERLHASFTKPLQSRAILWEK